MNLFNYLQFSCIVDKFMAGPNYMCFIIEAIVNSKQIYYFICLLLIVCLLVCLFVCLFVCLLVYQTLYGTSGSGSGGGVGICPTSSNNGARRSRPWYAAELWKNRGTHKTLKIDSRHLIIHQSPECQLIWWKRENVFFSFN